MTRRLALISLGFKLAALGLWPWLGWWSIGLFILPDFWPLWGLFYPSSQALVRNYDRFEPSQPGAKELWLTIDDGPDPSDTPQLLDVLDRHGARATFFLIGQRAQRHPDLVAAIVARGHEVANHTYSHRTAFFWIAAPGQVEREVGLGCASLAVPGATKLRHFRPPVGIKNLFLARSLERHGLKCIGWTIRSGDCFGAHADRIVRRVMDRLSPGAIVLVHEGPSVPAALRVRLIDQLLAQAGSRGFRAVVPSPEQLREPGATRP